VLCFAIAGLALASAKSYTINQYQSAMAGGTELKAGEYQVELLDQKAVITHGKMRAETAVKVENADQKYNSTTVAISTENGKTRIQEIHLGGTKTKLVFE
jgi:hypothetical protein